MNAIPFAGAKFIAVVIGLTSIEAVVDKLSRVEAAMPDGDAPLVAWGFDPIYFAGRRMDMNDMEKVSKTRPVVILHSNLHILNASRAVMVSANITADTNVEGIAKDAAGQPTGELQRGRPSIWRWRPLAEITIPKRPRNSL